MPSGLSYQYHLEFAIDFIRDYRESAHTGLLEIALVELSGAPLNEEEENRLRSAIRSNPALHTEHHRSNILAAKTHFTDWWWEPELWMPLQTAKQGLEKHITEKHPANFSDPNVVLETYLAGYSNYQNEHLDEVLLPGTILTLIREPDNVHDSKAVALYFEGNKVGYIPRFINETIARFLDHQKRLLGRIKEIHRAGYPAWQRYLIEVVDG